MIKIEEVAQKIYRFETPVPGVDSIFSVYFIHAQEGVLLEPGPTAAVPIILKVMEQLSMKTISYIIPTHVHVDHAGAAGKLAELFPEAKVVAHPQGTRHLVDPSRLIQSTKMAFGDDFESRYGPILPVPESQVKVAADEERIDIGGRELKVIYASGHAPHHLAIYDQESYGLFCGEALGVPTHLARSFPLPAVAPPSFDMKMYLETIEKLRKIRPRMLFYSHDGVGREPEELISRVAENTQLLGDIILTALKAGEASESIELRVKKHISGSLGLKPEQVSTNMLIIGYTLYFKKQGLA